MFLQNLAAQFTGQVLCDRYRIERQLGQKTGRRTFLAVDLQTELPVVIKLLLFNNEFVWDDLKLFEREAETLKHLNLPTIPCYLDYFEFDLPTLKGFALVQTYIDALSIEEVVQSGRRFAESELQQLATALLDILDYLHSLHPPVIHRDIKPSNILLSNRSGNSVGDVYLVDFGSVQNVAAKDGGTLTVVGTYGYMPMEQFGGKTVPASDLYSLGATLIYTISGVHPAELPQDEGKIQLPANSLSPGWRRWLEILVEPSLKKRFADVKTAKLALDRSHENVIFNKEKPFGSKIKLHKTAEMFDIYIPDRGRFLFNWVLVLGFSFFILPLITVVFFAFLPNNSSTDLLKGTWSLLSFFLFCFPLFYNFLYYFLGETHINIDRYRIVAHNNLGKSDGFRVAPSTPRSNIKQLHAYPVFRQKGTKKISAVKEIAIAAGAREYRFFTYSEAETEWILSELSEWIKVPIIYK
jgi:serine/threonine protein kinase